MKKILIVDDDHMARRALCGALQDAGYEAIGAEDGLVALELAKKDTPDLVLTDLKMPKMDGQELVEEIRKTDWGKSLPVIMLTASDETEAINAALQSNVTVYLTKASSLDDIIASVRQLAPS